MQPSTFQLSQRKYRDGSPRAKLSPELWSALEQAHQELAAVLALPLTETRLPTRTANMLEQRGLLTVRALLESTAEQLLEIPNFGEKTLESVYSELARLHPALRRSVRATKLEDS